ncbi:MAG TPA: BON domain-containing protein, partial [Usitatibacter sp.]|nr:BON domain-containing protein [Usitatibacter sp.]
MKTLATLLLVAAGVSLAACDKPRTNSAYNNSGASATPSSSATPATASPATTDTATTSAATGANSAASGQGAVSETVTTGKIKTAIAADDMLKGSDISVTTANGVVTLTGTAKTQDQVSVATGIAQ